jgi:hypothetical protein
MNPQNVHYFVLDLKADGAKLMGTMGFCKSDCGTPAGKLMIEDGKVDGDSIQFVVSGKAPDCGGFECQIGQGSAIRTN